MLLKFSSPDVQNAAVTDCASGAVLFRIATPAPGSRARAGSAASLYSSASSASSARDLAPAPAPKSTRVADAAGRALADVTWRDATASCIRLGDEVLAGAGEIFDTAYVKVLPDETLIPTRMEYVWRTTVDSLTLLDDDREVIGTLYQDHICLEGELSPASRPGAGHDYLELHNIPSDELVEILVTFLLICSLRERMYWITKYVYGQQAAPAPKTPLGRLRKKASRSLASWRDALLRSKRH